MNRRSASPAGVLADHYAVISIARLRVQCPRCHRELSYQGYSDEKYKEWTAEQILEMDCVTDTDLCPLCPECAAFVTIVLPETLELFEKGDRDE